MGLNNTPLSERIHIGIFGRRNAGKSSVINVMTGQNLAIVSDVAGTTTDPVQKAMELLPLGPVVMIDTPGLDDVGELGKMRVEKGISGFAENRYCRYRDRCVCRGDSRGCGNSCRNSKEKHSLYHRKKQSGFDAEAGWKKMKFSSAQKRAKTFPS